MTFLAIFLKQKLLAHRKVKVKRNTGGSVIKTLLEPSTDVRSLLLQQQEQAKASEKTASGQPSTGQPILCDRCNQWLNGPTQWEDHKLGLKHHKNSKGESRKSHPNTKKKREGIVIPKSTAFAIYQSALYADAASQYMLSLYRRHLLRARL